MVFTLNFLHVFGFAKPIAETLNAKKENVVLWNIIQGTGIFLALMLAIPLLTTTINVYKGGISPGDARVLIVPCTIVVELIVLEVTEMASWFADGRKLYLYPGGSWVMLKLP